MIIIQFVIINPTLSCIRMNYYAHLKEQETFIVNFKFISSIFPANVLHLCGSSSPRASPSAQFQSCIFVIIQIVMNQPRTTQLRTRVSQQNKKIIIARTIALLLLGALLILSFYRIENKQEDNYQVFLDTYGKRYEENEKAYRLYLKIRKEKEVEKHNANPSAEYTKAINEFSVLTQEEFQAMYMSLNDVRMDKHIPLDEIQTGPVSHLNISWTQYLPPVKDQGRCNAQYAFAAVAAVEAAYNIRINKTTDVMVLSEQQIIDCCEECSGCYSNKTVMGKDIEATLDYIQRNGLQTEKDYPWKERKQACKKFETAGMGITEYRFTSKMKTLLKRLDLGPVIVSLDARNWQDYDGGIFSNCGRQLTHQVLLVGRTPDYFLIRNSWSRRWGEKGYMKLAIGFTCGLSYESYTPII